MNHGIKENRARYLGYQNSKIIMNTERVEPFKPRRIRPGNDLPETMSVTAFTKDAKKVSEDVQRMIEAGWATATEKRQRGIQIQEMLAMAAVVRFQMTAIEHRGMSEKLKESIKPPIVNTRLLASTQPATDYVKTTLIECKDRLLILHKENQSLRRTLKRISKTVQIDSDPRSEAEFPVSSFWDDDAQMGEILGELELDSSDES